MPRAPCFSDGLDKVRQGLINVDSLLEIISRTDELIETPNPGTAPGTTAPNPGTAPGTDPGTTTTDPGVEANQEPLPQAG